MSRTADANLKDRILDAALLLLRVNGEEGLTMRAVAEAAGTTTPTVYKRFPTKESLVIEIAARERDRYLARQSRRKTIRDAVEGYLDWAVERPNVYGLIYGSQWSKVLLAGRERSGIEWTKQKLAEEFGGRPDQYNLLADTLWLIVHGAASLLAKQPPGPAASFVREQCIRSCDRILSNSKYFRDQAGS